jgi:GNAT superfamily N-acetyltransferase
MLAPRGYRFAGCENVLGLPLADRLSQPMPAGVEVAESGMDEFAEWLDAVVTGFAHPDDQGVPSDEQFPREMMERVMGDFAGAPGFSRYLARRNGRNGEIAGGASLRMDGGVALLCGAATLPAHRRRGVQTALLLSRLDLAREAGCDVAVVTTQPGSKSQENVQRQGFQLLYTRAVLVRG